PQYTALQGYSGAAGTTATSIQSQADTYYNYISDYWQLRFYDVTLPDGSKQNARVYFMNQVGVRVQNAVNDAGGVGNITLHGIDQLRIQGQAIGLEHINDFRLTVASACDAGGALAGNAVCTGGTSSLATSTVAPLAGDLFTDDTGYTLPTGPVASTASAVVRPQALASTLAGTPPTDELDAIGRPPSGFTSPSPHA